MICSACNQEILDGEKTAQGPAGTMHYRCFKWGTVHGKEITLVSLSKDIDLLKRRLQALEQQMADFGRGGTL